MARANPADTRVGEKVLEITAPAETELKQDPGSTGGPTIDKRDDADAAVPSSLKGTSLKRVRSDLGLLVALDILEVTSVAADLASLGGKSRGRAPLGRVTGRGLGQHLVDLLERETLRFRDEEDRVDEAAEARATPDEEDGRAHVAAVLADHVRGDDGDDGVPEPVRGGRETDTARTDRKREDLADEDPGCERTEGSTFGISCRTEGDSRLTSRTPGTGKEEDCDGDEGDLGVDGGNVASDGLTGGVRRCLVESDSHTDNSDDELADEHAGGTPDEERAATEALDRPERDRGGNNVDDLWVRDSLGRARVTRHRILRRSVKMRLVKKGSSMAPVEERN